MALSHFSSPFRLSVKRFLFLPFCFMLANSGIYAQGVLIGANPGQPHSSAGLDVDFTNKGLLLPRLTTAQRNGIGSPALGLVIYNTTTQCVESYFAAGWRTLQCNCTQLPSAAISPANPLGSTNAPILLNVANPAQGQTYAWTFASGSPSTSTSSSPSVTWNSTGTYTAVLTVTDANGCAASDSVQVVVSACSVQNASQTFNYTGSAQTWTVPAGVCSLTVECWGAAGWTGSYAGGQGGYAVATFPVTPGETVYIYVGQEGPAVPANGYSSAAFNGGGYGYSWNSAAMAGSGGGASDVRLGGQTLNQRVVVAGGGGGATNNGSCNGGHGGGTTGQNAGCSGYGTVTGGNQSSGGTGGQNGSFGQGANADMNITVGWVGGGGGGWYGGACGFSHQSGAGGSSYTGGHGSYSTSNASTSTGGRTGHGQVKITY